MTAAKVSLVALLIVCTLVVAVPAVAGRDPWVVAKARLSYPLYEPGQRLGFKLSRFSYPRCGRGRSRDSMYASYGPYDRIPYSRARGFALVEGSPEICTNPAESTPHGTRMIGGVKAALGVYCQPLKRCSLAQGFRNGYILYWTRGKTSIAIDSRHLTLTQFLRVATSLRPVT